MTQQLLAPTPKVGFSLSPEDAVKVYNTHHVPVDFSRMSPRERVAADKFFQQYAKRVEAEIILAILKSLASGMPLRTFISLPKDVEWRVYSFLSSMRPEQLNAAKTFLKKNPGILIQMEAFVRTYEKYDKTLANLSELRAPGAASRLFLTGGTMLMTILGALPYAAGAGAYEMLTGKDIAIWRTIRDVFWGGREISQAQKRAFTEYALALEEAESRLRLLLDTTAAAGMAILSGDEKTIRKNFERIVSARGEAARAFDELELAYRNNADYLGEVFRPAHEQIRDFMFNAILMTLGWTAIYKYAPRWFIKWVITPYVTLDIAWALKEVYETWREEEKTFEKFIASQTDIQLDLGILLVSSLFPEVFEKHYSEGELDREGAFDEIRKILKLKEKEEIAPFLAKCILEYYRGHAIPEEVRRRIKKIEGNELARLAIEYAEEHKLEI
ncbi:MAG: hypothetical protein QXH27_04090 [Candidatus Micrarchaeia archaeon]